MLPTEMGGLMLGAAFRVVGMSIFSRAVLWSWITFAATALLLLAHFALAGGPVESLAVSLANATLNFWLLGIPALYVGVQIVRVLSLRCEIPVWFWGLSGLFVFLPIILYALLRVALKLPEGSLDPFSIIATANPATAILIGVARAASRYAYLERVVRNETAESAES